MQPSTFILGHRGARGEYPENSLQGFMYAHTLANASQADNHHHQIVVHYPSDNVPSNIPNNIPNNVSSNVTQSTNTNKNIRPLKQALNMALAGIEFDVQLTADNKLLVFHDPSLQRITGQQGQVQQMSAAACMAHSSLTNRFITLDNMPPLLQGYQHIELEVKTHQATCYAKLVNALADYLTSDFATLPVIITSFDTHLLFLLQQDKRLAHIPRGLLIEQHCPPFALINTAIRLGCIQVGIQDGLIDLWTQDAKKREIDTVTKDMAKELTKEVTKEMASNIVLLCHRYGLAVTVWTVNRVERANLLQQLGVDAIITDYPSMLLTHMR